MQSSRKRGFWSLCQAPALYQALSAHYAFQMHFCNINSGNEKGLVENLVGWVRRNVLVPVPRVDNIEELNETLREACLKYRHHRIQGRDQTVGEQYIVDKQYLNPLPAFVFDTGTGVRQYVDEKNATSLILPGVQASAPK